MEVNTERRKSFVKNTKSNAIELKKYTQMRLF